MKRLVIIIGALFLTTSALSNQGATRFESTDEGVDVIPCLDNLPISYSIEVRGIHRDYFDGSGGRHFMRNVQYHGTITAIDLPMSWSGRGGGPWVINNNGNNNQYSEVFRRQEVWFADGDYPNLLWSLSFSGTYNANGDLVSLRINPPTFRCLPN